MRRTILAPLLLVCSCVYFRSAEVPMPTVFHPAPAADPDTLVVLLPGLGDSPEDFAKNGFVERIQATNPRCDVIAADAHFGYYRERSFLPRLGTDVIGPAADHYEHIWLVGISMGGFGSAIYAEEFPGTIDGMILLAPFMGDRDVIGSVASAGGIANWTPPADIDSIEDDAERKFNQLWAWFKNYAAAPPPANLPKMYIGWGTDDNLDTPNGMVADVLPPEQTMSMPGGHNWGVWKLLFAELVVRALSR